MGIVIFALISLFILSGCVQENGSSSDLVSEDAQQNQQSGSTDFLILPNVEVDATVISLSLTAIDEDPTDLLRPTDRAVVRIDSIYSSDDLGLSVGDEVNVEFTYSARPVILRSVPSGEPPSEDNEQTVSQSMGFLIENGVLVYSFMSSTYNQVTEENLPGLEEGSKFKSILWQTFPNEFNINKYELK